MKNMGRAFWECICTLRGAISLVFHKSWLSPACLHSDPIHSLGLPCLPLPAMILTLPQTHAPLILEGTETLAGQGDQRSPELLSGAFPLGFLVCGLCTAFCRVGSFNILPLFTR